MNDYLSRAVDREMSDIPRVRPALPSLFDSGNSSEIVTMLEPENPMKSEPSGNVVSKTRAENSPVLAAPLAAVNALWTDAAAIPEPPRIAELRAGKATAGVVATSTVAASQMESHPSVEQPQPAEVVVRPVAEAPPRPSLVPALEKDARPVASSRVARPRSISANDFDPAISPIPGETTKGVKPKSAAPPAVASVTPAMRPAVPTVPQVFPAPSRFERAATSRASRGDAPPRAIHITIGRIEVRAVHPPPEPLPPPRPAPVSPKVSLDEYLKQRNGDRR